MMLTGGKWGEAHCLNCGFSLGARITCPHCGYINSVEPVDAKAIRFEALEEAAKVCRTAQAQGLQSIREAIEEAIRGLK